MGGGAHDFVVDQATQPAHSLGEEGRKLAGACSPCLRPHLAQSSGFRIESKLASLLKKARIGGSWRREGVRWGERRAASGTRRAATCAGRLGPFRPKVSNLLTFWPAAIIRASLFTFSNLLSLNLLRPCRSLASANRCSPWCRRRCPPLPASGGASNERCCARAGRPSGRSR